MELMIDIISWMTMVIIVFCGGVIIVVIVLETIDIILEVTDFVSEVLKPGCINESFTTVLVKVVETKEKESYCSSVVADKATTMAHCPTQYEVTVSHDGREYTFNDEALYNKCKGYIDRHVPGILRTRIYKNGEVKTKIVNLK